MSYIISFKILSKTHFFYTGPRPGPVLGPVRAMAGPRVGREKATVQPLPENDQSTMTRKSNEGRLETSVTLLTMWQNALAN